VCALLGVLGVLSTLLDGVGRPTEIERKLDYRLPLTAPLVVLLGPSFYLQFGTICNATVLLSLKKEHFKSKRM